jgi:hypothetical protein
MIYNKNRQQSPEREARGNAPLVIMLREGQPRIGGNLFPPIWCELKSWIEEFD